MTAERFNLTKFIAAMLMREGDTLKLTVEDTDRYIKPIAKQIRKVFDD